MEALTTAPCWLVIGFNARPVVESLRRYLGEANDPIATVDYFADVESRLCSDYLFSVLKQEPGELTERLFHRKPGDYLVELAEILADEVPMGTILLGSGLDDRPDLWRRISSLGTFSGNDPGQLATLRNRTILFRYAEQIGLTVPNFHYFTSFSEFEQKLSYYTFPCVVRREGGGGGFNIFRCSNESQAVQAAQLLLSQFGNGIIESYEEGMPASVSLLGTSEEVITLSFNEQIVGSKTSFCPSEFAYCGNIAPLQIPNDTLKTLTEQFTKLGEKLSLLGTNGVDFILRNGEACVFELNPRFQGSLEPIELAYDLNLVEAHLKCFSDCVIEAPPRKQVAVRKILYAPKQITAPKLSSHVAKDRPIPGVIISQGSPFVSVLAHGKTKADALQKLRQKEQMIWSQTGM